jgi:excinuclease UvrABC nuclease subunit
MRDRGAQKGGRWITATDILRIPAGPGVYAIYEKRKLLYIGSSSNLYNRLYQHQHSDNRVSQALLGRYARVKYRPSVEYGDWLMVELRLLSRLKPPCNRCGVKRANVSPVNHRTSSRKAFLGWTPRTGGRAISSGEILQSGQN